MTDKTPKPKRAKRITKTGRPAGTMGCPSKYKPEFADRVVGLMQAGKTLNQMAASFGVSYHTAYNWADKNHDSYQPDFGEQVEVGKALAQSYWEDRLSDIIHGDLPNSGQTSLIFLLKSRYRDVYGDRIQTEVSGPNGGPVVVTKVVREIIGINNKDG